MVASKTIFESVEICFKNIAPTELYIDRIGFARSIIEIVNKLEKEKSKLPVKSSARSKSSSSAIDTFEKNFRIMFEHLNEIRIKAIDELTDERNHQRIDRLVRGFLRDNPITPRRESALELKKIENSLEDDIGTKRARSIIKSLRENYQLETDKKKT